jgi:hypothetical protein
MPTYRVVWEYAESNGSGFNEVYYTDAASPAAAATLTNTVGVARLALLHPLNTWLRIRASQVDANRATATRGINLTGTAPGAGGPLPVGSAAVCSLSAVAGGSRKLWLRGIPQVWYKRDGASGIDSPPAALLTALTNWFSLLAGNGYGIRKLAPVGLGLLAKRKIIQVDGTVQPGTSSVTLDLAPGYPVPGRVLIGGASKKDLPGLNGHWSIQAVLGAVVTIPYQTPQAKLFTGGAATMRQEQYGATSVFNPGGCAFDHFGTRTSRNPLSHSRGARRAARIRSAL